MTEADFGQCHVPIGEFREFKECEAQNKASRAKLHIRRGDAEAWMVVPYHLGGLLGSEVRAARSFEKSDGVALPGHFDGHWSPLAEPIIYAVKRCVNTTFQPAPRGKSSTYVEIKW